MSNLLRSHTIHAIAGGLLLFLLGNLFLRKAARTRRRGYKPSPTNMIIGYALVLFGLASAGTGLYAGLLGPVTVGEFTLRPFSFAPTSPRSYRRSIGYVRNNLEVSSKPAVGWHGASDKALEYTVNNKGGKDISCLVLRFKTKPGQPDIEENLYGPFPARQTTRKVVEVPRGVNRSYFDNIPEVDRNHIVGAQF